MWRPASKKLSPEPRSKQPSREATALRETQVVSVLGPQLHTYAGHVLACYTMDNVLAKLPAGPVQVQTVAACVRWFRWRTLEGRESPVEVTDSVQQAMWHNIRSMLSVGVGEEAPRGDHSAPCSLFLQEQGYFFIPNSMVQAYLCAGGPSCRCNDGAAGGQELFGRDGRLNASIFKDQTSEVVYLGVTKRCVSIETFLHAKGKAVQPLKAQIANIDADRRPVWHVAVWHAFARVGWETDPTRFGNIVTDQIAATETQRSIDRLEREIAAGHQLAEDGHHLAEDEHQLELRCIHREIAAVHQFAEIDAQKSDRQRLIPLLVVESEATRSSPWAKGMFYVRLFSHTPEEIENVSKGISTMLDFEVNEAGGLVGVHAPNFDPLPYPLLYGCEDELDDEALYAIYNGRGECVNARCPQCGKRWGSAEGRGPGECPECATAGGKRG